MVKKLSTEGEGEEWRQAEVTHLFGDVLLLEKEKLKFLTFLGDVHEVFAMRGGKWTESNSTLTQVMQSVHSGPFARHFSGNRLYSVPSRLWW